ncbi:MAG: DsbA family protein [Alphaproteobacteria bacterium]|nr:DsbA family protein [Alphaproteobacteria bacterium]
MDLKIRKWTTAAMLALTVTFLPAPATALDDKEKEEIGAFIREYLIANPEILFEVQDALQAKQEAEQREQAKLAISSARDAIFNSPHNVILGNPEGSVTIVEFFDYNCGFCKRAMKDMEEIIASDPDVRFILKEFPILGEDSTAAHTVSAALHRVAPEHYNAFHLELLGGRGSATEQKAIDVATSLGVDEDELREAMKDPAISESFQETYQIADSLGISGTPSYVIGDEAVFGAVGVAPLVAKIENIRTCESATC